MRYEIGDIIRLKNGATCKIINYYQDVREDVVPYVVEINGVVANFIVTDDMIQEKLD